jgi:hypothetical protein
MNTIKHRARGVCRCSECSRRRSLAAMKAWDTRWLRKRAARARSEAARKAWVTRRAREGQN